MNVFPCVDLIVAKYSEDTSWCQRFEKRCRLWIYDKKNKNAPLHLPNIPLFDRLAFAGAYHAKTPTGRESHTYLYHILKNYPDFAPYNIFCQGKMQDHMPFFEDGLNYLMTLEHPPEFLHFGKPQLSDFGGGIHQRGLPIERVYKRLFQGPVPEFLLYQLSASFWVSRKALLSRPKRFYEEMMQIVYEEPLSGYIFERLWGFVLHAPQLTSQTWNHNVEKSAWNLKL
jgi:hypothetical protein